MSVEKGCCRQAPLLLPLPWDALSSGSWQKTAWAEEGSPLVMVLQSWSSSLLTSGPSYTSCVGFGTRSWSDVRTSWAGWPFPHAADGTGTGWSGTPFLAQQAEHWCRLCELASMTLRSLQWDSSPRRCHSQFLLMLSRDKINILNKH